MNQRKKYIVATRSSYLAYTQTKQIVDMLTQKNPDCEFVIKKFTTKGDKIKNKPLTEFGGTGVFVKELENAVLEKRADFAVHSLKDVPAEIPKGLILAAFPKRENPCDLFLTNNGTEIKDMKNKFIVGTGSLRRQIQLSALRRDACFKDIRGNIDTRLKKLEQGEYDAIVIAAAGMIRLDKTFSDEALLSVEECIPAVGQGTIALECRYDDQETINILKKINHYETELAVNTERIFMTAIEGGCKFPMAAYAFVEKNIVTLNVMAGNIESRKFIKMSDTSPVNKANDMAKKIANKLKTACFNKNICLVSPPC